MKVGKGCVVAVAGLLVLGACSNQDEVLAEKDKAITEKSQEAEHVNKRMKDMEGTNLVLQRQVELRDAEIARLKNEVAKPAEPVEKPLGVESEGVEKPVLDSPAQVVKVSDPEVEVETRANGDLVLRLSAKELFASGSADLTASGQKVLGRVADTLKKHAGFQISVEGHTDDTPLKKTAARWKTNLNLSIARAISVRTFLNQKGKVEEGRMAVTGFGETRPLVPNRDDASRARNRRVEIVLQKKTA